MPPEDQNREIEDLLAQKAKLDELLENQFTKVLTIMFTDMKGSTALAEARGDMATRVILKQHNDIVFRGIKEGNGTLVKSMGDGTLSYFKDPVDAANSAIRIQADIDKFNMGKRSKLDRIIIRVGIHTGDCIFEGSDVYGDAVNTASRIESSANGGEIYVSESTHKELGTSGIYTRFAKEAKVKGKAEAIKLYKVFWNKHEIEMDKQRPADLPADADEVGKKSYKFMIMAIVIPIILVIILTVFSQYINKIGSYEKKRSISHSADQGESTK